MIRVEESSNIEAALRVCILIRIAFPVMNLFAAIILSTCSVVFIAIAVAWIFSFVSIVRVTAFWIDNSVNIA